MREPSSALGLERDGVLAAGIVFEDWNRASVVVHLAVRGRLTREFCRAMAEYAFGSLGVYKVIAPIWDENTRMAGIVEKIGFLPEARLHDVTPNGDIVLYSLLEKDCRFLGERYGKTRRRTAVA